MGSRPHFFKVILAHTLSEKKLRLPPRFLSEYGDLSSTALLLKLPNGRKWKVGLTRKDGGAWLQNGWQEFAEYFGLAVGHFLVFNFDGDSSFNVFIFDQSAFEINYPFNCEPEIFSEFEDDGSAEIPDNFSEKSSDMSSIQRSDDDISRKRVTFKEHAEANPFSKGRNTISQFKKFEALQRASSFKSRNSCFKVVIQPSYMKYGMYIPVDFARRYLCKKYGDCKFSIGTGRTWLVSYRQLGQKSRVKILLGFAKFLRDNHLKVGDVCVFELKNVQKLSFRVSIFPTEKDQDLLISQGKKSLKRKIEASAASASARKEEQDPKLTSWNPYFRIIIYPSHEHHGSFLNIPVSFVKTYLKDLGIKCLQEAVLQASDGKKWVARLYPRSINSWLQIRLSCKTFIVDNNLRADDVCVFELIKDVKILFNVFIFRLSDSKNSGHCKELDLVWPMRDPENVWCSSSKALITSQVAEKLQLQPWP